MTMRVAFRVDASLQIGTGHVMRCLTLAGALKADGAECHFISLACPGNLLDTIRQRGFSATALPTNPLQGPKNAVIATHCGAVQLDVPVMSGDWQTDSQQTRAVLASFRPDWLVVDHYALDHRWENALQKNYHKLLVIDDLADRQHCCDLLLDQNLGRHPADYAELVTKHCALMVGPEYALLRPEFAQLRDYSIERRTLPVLRHLLVTMGGVDQPNATGQVLKAFGDCELPQDCKISVVMGRNAPWLERVQDIALNLPWHVEVLVDINDMAQRMADSDLAIGAAGSTSWERCCLALPTLMVVLANNQSLGAKALHEAHAANLIGNVADISTELSKTLSPIRQSDQLRCMSAAAGAVTDGQGAGRVLEWIKRLN